MPITGPQGVSMQDLMGLGTQRLTAMAQGAMPSIAPSYMVLAALQASLQQEKGMQQPQPVGTVKNQVLAQAAQLPPPQQRGIGQMAPPGLMQQNPTQHFASGGSVSADDPNYNPYTDPTYNGPIDSALKGVLDYARTVGSKIMHSGMFAPSSDISNLTNAQILANMRSAAGGDSGTPPAPPVTGDTNYGNEGRNAPAPAAAAPAPSSPVSPDVGISISQPPTPPASGVAAAAPNPLTKYSTSPIKAKSLSDIPDLQIPKNTQLADLIARFGNPDPARLAQMQKDKQNAGLAALAANMVSTRNGRGFGAAFAPAAAAANTAAQTQQDKINQYMDQQNQVARELGLAQGTDEYNRFMANANYKLQQQQQGIDLAKANLAQQNLAVTKPAEFAIEQQKVGLLKSAQELENELKTNQMVTGAAERRAAIYSTVYNLGDNYVKMMAQAFPAQAVMPEMVAQWRREGLNKQAQAKAELDSIFGGVTVPQGAGGSAGIGALRQPTPGSGFRGVLGQ